MKSIRPKFQALPLWLTRNFHATWRSRFNLSRTWPPVVIPSLISFAGLLLVVVEYTRQADANPKKYIPITVTHANGNDVQFDVERTTAETENLVIRGRYLATIGVCAACHTPPAVAEAKPSPADQSESARKQHEIETRFKTDPDWFRYLDPEAKKHLAGGVPFILRVPNLKTFETTSGTVYARNITPDKQTGIGLWKEADIAKLLRSGIRKDGKKIFLFAPHTFFKNLADKDALALAVYLKQGVSPIRNRIPEPSLPDEVVEQYWKAQHPESPPVANSDSTRRIAPEGRSLTRAKYLTNSLVGCMECHSHHSMQQVRNEDGIPVLEGGKPKFERVLHPFTGGDPSDPYEGVFRLGPDLPLRPDEKGFATFPYPGYAVHYGGNLTKFGVGGPLSHISSDKIVRAIRQGISTEPDIYGRERPLSHVMLWQFYASMTDDDAYAIAEYIKTLQYVPHELPSRLIFYGDDWEVAFEKIFGTKPTNQDRKAYGKPEKP